MSKFTKKCMASPGAGQKTPEIYVYACTIAVMSYVADMSSDVMGNTEPILSCILSHSTQLKTGN